MFDTHSRVKNGIKLSWHFRLFYNKIFFGGYCNIFAVGGVNKQSCTNYYHKNKEKKKDYVEAHGSLKQQEQYRSCLGIIKTSTQISWRVEQFLKCSKEDSSLFLLYITHAFILAQWLNLNIMNMTGFNLFEFVHKVTVNSEVNADDVILVDTDVFNTSSGRLKKVTMTYVQIRRRHDIWKKTSCLRRLEDIWLTPSWRRPIYDVLKASDLRRLQDVWFRASWRHAIYVVLKTSNLRRLEDVWLVTYWRRLIYDVLKTSVKRRLCSNVYATSKEMIFSYYEIFRKF